MTRALPALFLLMCACEAAPTDVPADAVVWVDGSGSVDVELGVGITEFTPVADGALVDIITGIQGGYHIWVSARLAASEVAVARFHVESRLEADGPDGPLVGSSSNSQGRLELQESGFRDRLGIRAFIANPAEVRGQRIAIRLVLSCPDGRHGVSERVVVPK